MASEPRARYARRTARAGSRPGIRGEKQDSRPASGGTANSLEARALWFVAHRRIEFRQETVPPPDSGQVRVRTIASAPSQGTELLVYRGEVPGDLPLDLPTLAGTFAFPIKYGYAAVGRILDVGPGTSAYAPGDLVFVHHPHQSAFVVAEGLLVRLPPGIHPEVGVFTANLETAANVLLDTPLRFGEIALVFGLGSVGLLIAQLLKRAGARRVLGVDPLPRRRSLALLVGVDEALEPGPKLAGRVQALTDGRGADLAIEASGSPDALQAAIDTVGVEGTVTVVSWYGAKSVPLSLGGHFHRGRVRLRSSQVGRLDPALSPRWDLQRRLALAVSLLKELPLAQLITHRFSFDEAAAAYRLLDEQPGETGQVVLTYE